MTLSLWAGTTWEMPKEYSRTTAITIRKGLENLVLITNFSSLRSTCHHPRHDRLYGLVVGPLVPEFCDRPLPEELALRNHHHAVGQPVRYPHDVSRDQMGPF